MGLAIMALLAIAYAVFASIATGDTTALVISILGGIGVIWALLKS